MTIQRGGVAAPHFFIPANDRKVGDSGKSGFVKKIAKAGTQ
jgi:hypothetical protein